MLKTIPQSIALIRLSHWIKNGFIFLPLLFAGKIELILTQDLLFIFLSFCLASSAIYILNDLVDIQEDQQHPVKKNRPLASGHLSKKTGGILCAVFVILFIFSLTFLPHNYTYLYVLAYFILNIAYIFVLKHISIVDVSCIGIGFVLRVMAGGAAGEVYVSHWMIIMTFLLAISIGFAKRRDDLILVVKPAIDRKSLAGYTVPFLDLATGVSFSITLISYILYSISPEVIKRIGSDKLYLTSFFVFIGIMRYLQITIVDRNSGAPLDVLRKDRFLHIVIALWTFTFLLIIYGKML
jgi:decaprenyl-phosphate phosphoribosyltransferase